MPAALQLQMPQQQLRICPDTHCNAVVTTAMQLPQRQLRLHKGIAYDRATTLIAVGTTAIAVGTTAIACYLTANVVEASYHGICICSLD